MEEEAALDCKVRTLTLMARLLWSVKGAPFVQPEKDVGDYWLSYQG